MQQLSNLLPLFFSYLPDPRNHHDLCLHDHYDHLLKAFKNRKNVGVQRLASENYTTWKFPDRTFSAGHPNSPILTIFALNIEFLKINPFNFPGFFSYIFYTTSKFPNIDYIRSQYGVLNPFAL